MKFLLINGPNLNLLGKREPHIYGDRTLEQVTQQLVTLAQQHEIELQHMQSNAEHEIVERIHQAMDSIDFIIINPGAFTHTSVAIRDALLGVNIPCIEVHLSNVHAREAFRQHSYISDLAKGVICGLGEYGYEAALMAAKQHYQSLNVKN